MMIDLLGCSVATLLWLQVMKRGLTGITANEITIVKVKIKTLYF